MTRPLVARLIISDHPTHRTVLVASTRSSLALSLLRVAGVEHVARWDDLAAGFILPEHLADAVEQAAEVSGVPVRRRVRKVM
jgi:hypothetical protein